MYILVDYDNLDKNEPSMVNMGLEFIVDTILDKVTNLFEVEREYKIRLYGGWYSNKKLTRKAENLIRESSGKFPKINCFSTTESTIKSKIYLELAYSILQKPDKHLFNTYRIRNADINFKFHHPIKLGCRRDDCPLIIVSEVINANKCTAEGCSHTLDQMIEKREQKLVDNMISIDLAYISDSDEEDSSVLVSSDDDFLPAIIYFCTKRNKLMHLYPGNLKSLYELDFLSDNYSSEIIGA